MHISQLRHVLDKTRKEQLFISLRDEGFVIASCYPSRFSSTFYETTLQHMQLWLLDPIIIPKT